MIRSGHENERVGGLVWGIGLVLLGSVILAQYLGVMPFSMWRDWWPLVVMMVGVGQIVAGRSAKSLGDGVTTILIGVWCYIATNRIFGLSWRNSWPLALVAGGMGMVVCSIASGFMRRGDDVREVKIDG